MELLIAIATVVIAVGTSRLTSDLLYFPQIKVMVWEAGRVATNGDQTIRS